MKHCSLADILEKEVDQKYYFSEKMLNYFLSRAGNFNGGRLNFKTSKDIASTITSSSKSIDISDNLIVGNEAYYHEHIAGKTRANLS